MNSNKNDIDFFAQLESPFEKTEAELWDKIAERTQEQPKAKTRSLVWLRYAAAIASLLVLGAGLFMGLYTTEHTTPKGTHASHILPDGSTIELNAETQISYKPYIWFINRKLNLNGEAFFKVKKGKKFAVHSAKGVTEVLGTSFNIYARQADYEVFCKTGMVRVSSTSSQENMLIEPGQLASLSTNASKSFVKTVKANDIMAWQENQFVFNETDLNRVMNELERQYNIRIELDIKNTADYIYTGFFNKSTSAQPSLELICKSFNLSLERSNKTYYKVSEIR